MLLGEFYEKKIKITYMKVMPMKILKELSNDYVSISYSGRAGGASKSKVSSSKHSLRHSDMG